MEIPNVPKKPSRPDTSSEEILLDIKAHDRTAARRKQKGMTLLGLFEELNNWFISQSPIKLTEKLLFFELFVAALNAGISVSEAMKMMETQTPNPRFKTIISQMRRSIESGDSLAQAMGDHEEVFDLATVSIIEAGEKSGKLNDVMKELVTQYERMYTIQKKVKSVMTYPMIVIIVMVLLIVVVMTVVVPKLVNLFQGAENLPMPTKILIGASDFFVAKWGLVVLGVIAVVVLFSSWKKSATGKKQWACLFALDSR
jgi:type II secretory pathway component PulF